MVITVFQSVAYYQLANVLPVWIQQHVALDVGSLRIPVPWYQSVDPLFSILGVPLLFWIWKRQASRRREPGDLAKIGTGAWLAAASNLILVAAILAAGGRARAPGLAVSLLRRPGNRLPVLLAHAARAGLARGAGEGQRDHDGVRLHEPVRRQQPRSAGSAASTRRWARRLLDDARRDRRDRRCTRDALRAPLKRTLETRLDEPVRLSARALEVE